MILITITVMVIVMVMVMMMGVVMGIVIIGTEELIMKDQNSEVTSSYSPHALSVRA